MTANDGARDGGGDGVAVQGLLGALEGELGVLDGQGGVGQGVLRGLAPDGGQHRPGGHPAAHGHVQVGDLPAGGGGDGLPQPGGQGAAGGAGVCTHPGGGAGCFGEGPGVGEADLHLPHQSAPVPHLVGGGHRLHRAGQGLQSAGQGDLGRLARRDVGGVTGLEGHREGHGGGVGDVGNGRPGGDQVPLLDVEGLDHPAADGLHLEAAGQGVIVHLGLLHRQLGLLEGGLGAARVDAVEELVLLHLVPVLKRGLQDLPGDQGGHLVGLDGGDRARAGHRHRQVLALDLGGLIGPHGGCPAAEHGPDHDPEQQDQDGRNHKDALDPFAPLLGTRPQGGGLRLRARRGEIALRDSLCGFHGIDSFMYRVETILPPTPGPDGGLGQTAGPSRAFVPSYRQTISFPKRKAKKFIKFFRLLCTLHLPPGRRSREFRRMGRLYSAKNKPPAESGDF